MFKKTLVCLIILLFYEASFGQTESASDFFNDELKKAVYTFRNQPEFYKAYFFLKKKEWDSTIVYSMKQLRNKNATIDNYCHLFRAISLQEKKLLQEAEKEFFLIPTTFKFYSIVTTHLGEIALERSHYSEALYFFNKAERQNKSRYSFKGSGLYHNIGLCYFHLKQFDKAERYLMQGLQIQEKEKDTLMLIGSYMDIANLYYEQYEDQLAIPYFEKAYQLSKKTKDFKLKQNAAMNMAAVEENRKNLTLALVYRKEYENWKDSLNDQNKVWAIAELEKKYIVKQKQKEISLLEAKNKIREAQRNGLFYSSLLLLALFGTGVYFYQQKIKNNKIILSQKVALGALNATKDSLFSIVSHDLRSSVNALKTSNNKLQENLRSKDYHELDKQLHSNSMIANGAYSLLDNLLHWAMLQTKQDYFHQESHRLFMIVEQVAHSYVPLMIDKQIRFENKVPKDAVVFIDLDSVKIVLRNLLDNAIKFTGSNGLISIYTSNFDGQFYDVVVEDSGAGMSQEVIDELLRDSFSIAENKSVVNAGTGLGMQLCKSLIEKNGGKLAIESTLNIGTKIIVSLPVNA